MFHLLCIEMQCLFFVCSLVVTSTNALLFPCCRSSQFVAPWHKIHLVLVHMKQTVCMVNTCECVCECVCVCVCVCVYSFEVMCHIALNANISQGPFT